MTQRILVRSRRVLAKLGRHRAVRQGHARVPLAAWSVALLLVLAGGSAVQATAITYSQTIPQTDTAWGPISLSFPQFDPAAFDPGNPNNTQLVSVTVSISGFAGTQMFADIEDPTLTATNDVQNQVQVHLEMRRPDNPLVPIVGADSALFDHSATLGPGDYPGPFPATFDDPVPPQGDFPLYYSVVFRDSPGGAFTTFNPADLALFTGPGTVSMDTYATAPIDFVNGGSGPPTTQFNITVAGGTFSVTYELTPEPSSILLFGLATGGLLVARLVQRRRQRRPAPLPANA